MDERTTTKPFGELLLWVDEEAHPAEWNMAADEALLEENQTPLLRIYRWSEPCISIGFFEPLGEIGDQATTVVRRMTGGGVVRHGSDLTYSVVVPSAGPLQAARPEERYRVLHGAVASAMRHCGIDCHLAEEASSEIPGGLCFKKPVPGDLLVDGNKVAGAGQRRTRQGLLHQGSILGVELPERFAHLLADALASDQSIFVPSNDFLQRVGSLADLKYGSKSWLERR